MIPHNKPTLGVQEAAAAGAAIRSGWVAQGKSVLKFENALCRRIGLPAGHAVAVSSGTAALYMALHALNLKPGTEVLMPTYVCTAVLNAVNLAQLKPVLCDIDSDTLNISPSVAAKKITKKTGAILVTHTYGMPGDITALRRFGLPIIEDSAQALGSTIGGVSVGIQGTIGTFSFYASKMITAGYGGMVVSKDKRLIEKIKDYREFDYRKDYKERFNFSLSDINAAVGLVQLSRLPQLLKRRANIAARYRAVFSAYAEVWPAKVDGRVPNNYRFLLRSPHAKKLQAWLEEKGIRAIVPTERFELLHRYLKQNPKQFPVSEKVVKETLSLPVYPSLTDSQVTQIIRAVESYFKQQ